MLERNGMHVYASRATCWRPTHRPGRGQCCPVRRLNKQFKASTIRVYISAVRSLHVEEGYGNPLKHFLKLKQALRALDNVSERPTKKMPITLDILTNIYYLLGSSLEDQMLWASFTLIYYRYGCLRAGEVIIDSTFNPNVNLQVKDVSFTNEDSKNIMTVRIKSSKTDKTNKGFDVYIACVPHVTCAKCAMLSYLKMHRPELNSQQPLFQTNNGMLLTKTLFHKQLKLYIAALGYVPQSYSGHSYRAGCTSDAAASGFMDWELKLLGRWTSDAYQGYIRTPRHTIAQFSGRLIQKFNK